MAYVEYKPKISKDEFQEKAEYLLSAHSDYEQVIVPRLEHRAICSSWWGQAWCKNLDRYSFWSDRLTLGRNYVRNGAVIDLKINGGKINALVIGRLNEPYDVKIKIAHIPLERQHEIEALVSGKIHNLEEITSGNFPEELKNTFFQVGVLFPRSDELDFTCTCHDWADMCKHVAAALYGIGVRIDSNPLLLFEMRGIDVKEFISNVVKGKIEKMLANFGNDSPRIFKSINLMEVFGLEVPMTISLPTESETVVEHNTIIEPDTVAKPEVAVDNSQSNDNDVVSSVPVEPVEPVEVYTDVLVDVPAETKKHSKDFTWEESVALFNRIKEIGLGKAATEFGITSGTAMVIRKKILVKMLHAEDKQNTETASQEVQPKNLKNADTEERIFKRITDFTPEQIMTTYYRIREIGRSLAAFEARTTESVLDTIKKKARAMITAGEAEEYKPTGKPPKKDIKVKTSNDFTEEEKAKILDRAKDVGFGQAALEADTTVWTVQMWHKKGIHVKSHEDTQLYIEDIEEDQVAEVQQEVQQEAQQLEIQTVPDTQTEIPSIPEAKQESQQDIEPKIVASQQYEHVEIQNAPATQAEVPLTIETQQDIEPQTHEPQTHEPQTHEPQTHEPQTLESQQNEPQITEVQQVESQQDEQTVELQETQSKAEAESSMSGALDEELFKLKAENALLKQKLTTLVVRINNLRAAINHLI